MTSAFTHNSSMGAVRSHAVESDPRPVPIRIGKVNRLFLTRAIRSGASLRRLSRVLNISVHQVYQLCLHYGLAVGKHMPPHLPAIIRQQTRAGKSLVQLAQQHHISYYRVAAIVHQSADGTPPMDAAYPGRHHDGLRQIARAKHSGRTASLAWRRDAKPAA